jgi:hypothetical protein
MSQSRYSLILKGSIVHEVSQVSFVQHNLYSSNPFWTTTVLSDVLCEENVYGRLQFLLKHFLTSEIYRKISSLLKSQELW